MYVVGFAAVAGGCPCCVSSFWQGRGSSDAVTFLGMLIGAAFAANFGLSRRGCQGGNRNQPAVAGGQRQPAKVAVIVCIVVLFICGHNLRRKKTAK